MNVRELIKELDSAVSDGSAERRAEILARLTDVFVTGSESYADNQIEFFDDVFMRIATAIEGSARAVLAQRLATTPRAPLRISRVLATDDDIDVAGPVLSHSQRLDDATLINAARSKSQQHLLAISRRHSLGTAVTDILVERGDRPVILSAASNPSARFSEAGYTKLVDRSAGDDELTSCVAVRPDVPRQQLLRLLVRASHDVRCKLVAAHPTMADAIEQAVADAATRLLEKSGALPRDYDEARARIESLRAAGAFGDAEVCALAADGKHADVTAALAALSGLPIDVAERAMTQPRPEAVLVIAKAIGLTWPTAKALLRLRASTRGISPGELEQCADTFTRLNPATVRQIVEFQKRRARTTRFGRTAA